MTDDANVDDILTAGAWGLEYWKQFHPHFVKLWPRECGYTVQQLDDRYHEQQGLNLVRLNNTLKALTDAKTVGDDQITNQRNIAGRLPNVWSGNASQVAQKMIWEQIGLAEADVTKLQAAINAIGTFINDVKSAVDTKAEFTLALLKEVWIERVAVEWKMGQNFTGQLEVKIDGKTPEDVGKMIEIREAREWLSYDQICWVYDKFTETKSLMDDPKHHTYKDGESNKLNWTGSESGNFELTPNADIAQAAVNRWLDNVFKSDFAGKLSKWNQMCTDVDNLITAHYTSMNNALGQLDRDSYPQPAGAPSPSSSTPSPSSGTPSSGTPTSGTPTSGTPTSGTPTSGTPTTGTPTTGTPTSGTPTSGTPTSGTPSALTTMSGLASALTSTLSTAATTLAAAATSGLSTLTTTISDAFEDLTENKGTEDKDDDKKDEQKKNASSEFDLAGKHYKLEVGADGQPKLVETSADGKTHEYSVKLDSNGIPVISSEEKTDDDKSTAGTPTAGTPSAGTPSAGTPSGGTPSAGTPSGGTPSGGTPSGGTPSTGTPSEGSPTAGAPTTGTPTTGTPNAVVPPGGTNKPVQDGEHAPKTTEQPAPARTGAELAEAGPL
ncbi:hypothetical protein [Nocardia aurea]|uniref:hypothetical protein n=1 Tax=Nocardia aurea TaxID=2144174 RepID=UPI0033A111FC